VRYYRIDLSDKNGNPVYLRSLNGQPLTSLAPDGKFNPGALQVELDIPVYPLHAASANAFVKVWGVGIQDIIHQSDYNDLNIKVFGGMSAGLPLANPNQSGLLMQGTIYQAYGNWRGTEQSLGFYCLPPIGASDAAPLNVPFVWRRGTALASAIRATLQVAVPDMTPNINISPRLVLGFDEVGFYQNLQQFAGWLNQRTIPIIGGAYPGVMISTRGGQIQVWDGTGSQSNTIRIQPQDLIGQPTWLSPLTITFQTVMRADIDLQSVIALPQTIIQQTATSQLRQQDKTSFTGNFIVQAVQHFGNFRQPSADAWNTTFQAAAELKPAPAGSATVESITVQ
jgi:hypothetical protein